MDKKYFLDNNDPNWLVVEETNKYIKLASTNNSLEKIIIKIIKNEDKYKIILQNLDVSEENEIIFSSDIPYDWYLTILHHMLLKEKNKL